MLVRGRPQVRVGEMTFILALLSNPTILAIVGGAVAVVAAFFKGRAGGAKKERDKQLRREAKARDISDEVENDIGTIPPNARRKELETWSNE